jgi:hypothetical protein
MIPNTSHLSVRKLSIQFLCTAHLYSAKNTVVLIRIYIIDTVYGSYFYLTVKNQRHDWVGINDFQKFRYSKMNLDSVPLSLIKFKYEKTGAHLFPLLL